MLDFSTKIPQSCGEIRMNVGAPAGPLGVSVAICENRNHLRLPFADFIHQFARSKLVLSPPIASSFSDIATPSHPAAVALRRTTMNHLQTNPYDFQSHAFFCIDYL
jgi:hypothetical protein